MAPRKHMRDLCQIGTFDTVTTGPEPTEAWTYASEGRCRFDRVNTRETVDGDKHSMTNVRIHLPIGVTITGSSRIKLTRRNGATLGTPEYYDVVGDPWYARDNRSIICDCISAEIAG